MIQIQALSKRNGDNLAVHDMSFTVRPGQVTGAMGLLRKAGTAAPLAVRPTARQRRQLPPRGSTSGAASDPALACWRTNRQCIRHMQVHRCGQGLEPAVLRAVRP